MDYKDYYKVMGVAKTADSAEIKRAYRKLARKYHPDVSNESNAEEKFKELQEAYEVLKDPEKRKAYDQLGAGWKAGQEFRPPPGWEMHREGFSFGEGSGFSDFFESLFGGGFARRPKGRPFAMRGADLSAKIEISLEDAFLGSIPTISLMMPEVNAQGVVVNQQKSLKIKIPAGVTNGQKLRLAGQGGSGQAGGPKGDLYVEIMIKPHPYFSLEGKDVYLNLPIAPWEAALGAVVQAKTLAGLVDMKVPAGAKSGQKLRLKGRGLKHGGAAGDQYVTFFIQTPKAMNEAQRAFYENMRDTFQWDPRT